MGDIWCRDCGGPIFEEGLQLVLDGIETFHNRDARTNLVMKCLPCAVPDIRASPSSPRIQNRILYYLVTRGVVRVGSGQPGSQPMDVVTGASMRSVRNYIGQSVSQIRGLWVSTHVHENYVLGHLRTSSTRCNCSMA